MEFERIEELDGHFFRFDLSPTIKMRVIQFFGAYFWGVVFLAIFVAIVAVQSSFLELEFESNVVWKELITPVREVVLASFMSIMFYIILVKFPKEKEVRRIKKNSIAFYDNFKVTIAQRLINIAHWEGVVFTPEFTQKASELLNHDLFRKFWSLPTRRADISAGDAVWGRVKGDESTYRDFVLIFAQFKAEIDYLLNNIPIEDDRVYWYLKHLSRVFHERLNRYFDETSVKLIMWLIEEMFLKFDMGCGNIITSNDTNDFYREILSAL